MGIREENKQITRNRILECTRKLFLINGFVKVSTKDIAQVSSVAQGSIFLHFTSKEKLIYEVIVADLRKLQNEIGIRIDPNQEKDRFLESFLDVLSNHESILARLYKDKAYLSDDIKKVIEQLDVSLKNLIFENTRRFSSKPLSIVDSFINIDAYMSQIKVYLLEKDIYNDYSSVIKLRHGKLTKLYRTLFS